MLSRDSSLLLFCSDTECRCCKLSVSLTADSGMDPAAPKLEGASLALLDVRLSIRLRSVDGCCWDSVLLASGTLSKLVAVGSTEDKVEIDGSSTEEAVLLCSCCGCCCSDCIETGVTDGSECISLK